MPFEVKILGVGSASPVYNRHPSAQFLIINQKYNFLIDCGEGTQFQLIRYRLPIYKISHIFISHLHGDHYFGLIGLLSSMHLWGREKPLTIFAPQGLSEIITTQMRVSESVFKYDVHLVETNTHEYNCILSFDDIEVYTIPLHHRIKCCGFLFREKPKKRRLINARLPQNITLLQRAALRNGEDIKDENGNLLYKNDFLTLPPKKSLSYAYCSDTAYSDELIAILSKVDMLYHEATFLQEHAIRAKETFHSTAVDAATIASKANVSKLLLGHFSGRYKDLSPFIEEARKIFPNTLLAEEGNWYIVKDESEINA